MSRSIEIKEYEDGSASISIFPGSAWYNFESFSEALEALPNLEELQCTNTES